MNWDRVEGNWKTFKGQVQQKWGKLTDDDLDVIEGKRTELAGRLQERYGYAKDEAEKNIDTWLKDGELAQSGRPSGPAICFCRGGHTVRAGHPMPWQIAQRARAADVNQPSR